jgi:hypothetical protein
MEKLFKVVCNPRNPKILAIGKNYVKHVKVVIIFFIFDNRKWEVTNHRKNPSYLQSHFLPCFLAMRKVRMYFSCLSMVAKYIMRLK